jgi:hypothetical protein
MTAKIALATATASALAGCAVAQPVPVHGATPGYVCSNAGLERFVGQPATEALGSEMLRVSGARVLRWLQPGQIVTMEFSAERLTVHLDSSNRVERASCG